MMADCQARNDHAGDPCGHRPVLALDEATMDVLNTSRKYYIVSKDQITEAMKEIHRRKNEKMGESTIGHRVANGDKIAEARKKTRGEATTPDSTPVATPAAAGGTRDRARCLQQQGGRCVKPRGEQPQQRQPTHHTRGQNAARLRASKAAGLQVAKSQEDQGEEVNDRDENTFGDELGAKRGQILAEHASAEEEPPKKVKKGEKHTTTATSVCTLGAKEAAQVAMIMGMRMVLIIIT